LFTDPLWLPAAYLLALARQRARAVHASNAESGGLSLEWIIIVGIVCAAAIAAGVVFVSRLQAAEAKIP
jgi:hypothetical protein